MSTDPPLPPEGTTWNRFAPAALRHALCRDGADAPDDAFEAAVLWADISGYSTLAARLAERGAAGAELLSEHLNSSFAVMLREVHARGGEVERFAGDALLATFRPGPDALAGAVVRARDCAQVITSRLDGARAGEVALSVHAGVAAGILTTRHVPLLGTDRAFVLAGEPLIEVAAAAAAAPPGEVRLTPAAARLAETAVRDDAAATVSPAAEVLAQNADLAPYINGALRDRLGVAADANWLAELRRVTAVFVMPEVPNPDAAALARVAHALGEAVVRFEGLLYELGVDDKGLVAVLLFGLRQTREDQAQRALRAAIALHGTLATAGIPASLGVASGRVYCGVVGDARRSELAVVGDPMNLAARLMQAAHGGVLCDPATAGEDSAQQAFTFTPVPGLSLKGMPAGLLPQRPASRSSADDSAAKGPTPAPLGRETEWGTVLRVLQSIPALQAASGAGDASLPAGRGGALLLRGDAGIGKSALLAAAVTEATRLGAALLRVHGQALEQVSPYHAWRSATAQLLGVDLSADRLAQLTRLQMALAGDAEAASLASLLSAVLPHAPPATAAVEALDAQARAERLRELLLSLVTRAAAAVPLVLVVEDAHWLDSASWTLLQALAARRAPVVVIATSRPLDAKARASLSQWQDAAGTQVLDLGPLSREASAELMRRKLGVSALTDGVEALVHARAAGHPYFTEELVLALRDAGALRVEGGLCSLAASGGGDGEHVVPDTLAHALTVRIDAVGEGQRLALKIASVLGRDFEVGELEAVYPLRQELPQLREHLQALVAHELLLAPRTGHYRFKHAITRDVAYDLLPFALRRDLHRSLAEHLERDPARKAAPQSTALLAHHWSHAEVPEQALAANETAGMHALERFANREAVHFLHEALRWNEALGRPTAPERVARWLSASGLAHRLLGELEASRRMLEQALRELGAAVPAKTFAARMRTIWALLQFAFRRPRVALASEPPNAANTAVEAYAQLAMLAYYDGDVESVTACSVLAGRVAQSAAPAREVAALHGSLAHIAAFFRLSGTMNRLMEATQLVAERVPTPLVIGTACQFTGHLSACQGDFARYESDMKRAKAAYAELGRCRQLDEADTNLSCLHTHLGQLEQAFEVSVALEKSGRARDDLQTAGWGVVGQARACFAQGRLAQTLEYLDACQALLADKPTEIEVAATRALALWRSARPDEALAQALHALQLLERAQSTSYFSLLPYGHVMETLVQLAGGHGTAELRSRARAAAPRMLKAFRRYAARLPLARAQLALWTGALADLEARHGDAHRAWRNALQLAATSQVPLDLPLAQRWLARALNGAEQRAMLQQAADGFASLGRQFEAEEARAAVRDPSIQNTSTSIERIAA